MDSGGGRIRKMRDFGKPRILTKKTNVRLSQATRPNYLNTIKLLNNLCLFLGFLCRKGNILSSKKRRFCAKKS